MTVTRAAVGRLSAPGAECGPFVAETAPDASQGHLTALGRTDARTATPDTPTRSATAPQGAAQALTARRDPAGGPRPARSRTADRGPAEPLTLFELTAPAAPPLCGWCDTAPRRKQPAPATVRVRTRPDLLQLGPMWSWDLAGGDDQARRSTLSAPCCDPCARYLAACWQYRRRDECGQFRELSVIWFVPLDDAAVTP